jgi:hypothetical protein
MSEDLLSVQAEIEEYCRSSAISLDQIIKVLLIFYYSILANVDSIIMSLCYWNVKMTLRISL